MNLTVIERGPDRVIVQADLDERAALVALRDDPAAERAVSRAILDAGFAGAFWECRQLRDAPRPFEFAIVASPRVARLRANWQPFAEALRAAPAEGAVAFDNLGAQSRLVAPTPGAGLDGAHLVAFLHSAPLAQRAALWRLVAHEALAWLASRPLWLSTSGLGVSWLHVRLDPRPKYYAHQPYRDAAAAP